MAQFCPQITDKTDEFLTIDFINTDRTLAFYSEPPMARAGPDLQTSSNFVLSKFTGKTADPKTAKSRFTHGPFLKMRCLNRFRPATRVAALTSESVFKHSSLSSSGVALACACYEVPTTKPSNALTHSMSRVGLDTFGRFRLMRGKKGP